MSLAPAKLMKMEERRNGVRGTTYTDGEGVSLRLAIKNLWFDSKDFGFMRFEGSFQKENQMYQWKVHANSVIFSKCFLNLILLYQVWEQWRGILGLKKKNKQKNDHTTGQKAVGVPISDLCFKSSKKTRLFL